LTWLSQEKRLQEIEAEIARDGFWDNPGCHHRHFKERTLLGQRIDAFHGLEKDLEEAGILLELAIEEADADTLAEVSGQISDLGRRMHQFSLDMMLDGDDDQNNAIISINAGAGGTEAQDWAEMLFRMYLRWVEARGLNPVLSIFSPVTRRESKASPLPPPANMPLAISSRRAVSTGW
jgi:peptide chain release factor 2